jgi:hypothetical protein
MSHRKDAMRCIEEFAKKHLHTILYRMGRNSTLSRWWCDKPMCNFRAQVDRIAHEMQDEEVLMWWPCLNTDDWDLLFEYCVDSELIEEMKGTS